ncbi:MAG: hypothetical protein V1706_15060 [Pseudomonadota bacterium]
MSRKKKFAPGTFIERDLYLSRAFHTLSGFAPQLLIIFLGKRKINKNTKEVINRDEITMTLKELENLYNRGKQMKQGQNFDGIERKRIYRAIDELLAKGFIKIVYQGGNIQGDRTIYALIDDWQFWQSGQVMRERAKRLMNRGFCEPKSSISQNDCNMELAIPFQA